MQLFIVNRGLYSETECIGVYGSEASARAKAAEQMATPDDQATCEQAWEENGPHEKSIASWSLRKTGDWLSIERWDLQP